MPRHSVVPTKRHNPRNNVQTSFLNRLQPEKILVCQQRQIGDVLLATPSIRLLAERFPDAEIHVLTEKKCAPVLLHNPRVTRTWLIEPKKGWTGMLSLYRAIRREGFELVVDFQQLIRLRGAVLASAAAVRLSFKPKWYNRLFYNLQGEELCGYAAKAKSGLLAPLGITWNGEPPEIFLTEEERNWTRDFLAEEGIAPDAPFLTLDPTHRRITRKWPAEHYAELIRLFAVSHPGLKLFLLYGPGEREEVESIRALAGNPPQCVVSEHMTSLREMGAILDRAAGHIGNCSSPRHFAVAVGTPTLIILGSTKPGAWTYPGEGHLAIRNEGEDNCISCNRSTCERGTLECLKAVTPECVHATARRLMPRLRELEISRSVAGHPPASSD